MKHYLNTLLLSTLFVSATFAASFAAAAQAADGTRLERGKIVYDYWCATCHSPGAGMPGTQALQAKYKGNPPAVLVERTDLTPELVKFTVRNGVSVMAFFRKTEISDVDLEALAAFVTKAYKPSAP